VAVASLLGLAAWGIASAQERTPRLDKPSVPVRIVIGSLDIDLPVLSSEANVPGNVPGYPLCDVAQYWTAYDLPGAPGTTWILAHAQQGMFLPLLEEAVATDGASLLGREVELQLRDGRLLTYRIGQVERHAIDRDIAQRRSRKAQRLVLQTSEGPAGTIPKLLMAARLVRATSTDEPAPAARPRACSDAPSPRRTIRPDRSVTPGASLPPSTDPTASVRRPEEAMPIVLGAGLAVVAGAVVLTLLLRRRAR
jgi:hypothetical protein